MASYWKKVLITSKYTIEEAIKVIDEASMRVAVVVDVNNKLKGIVTDGDVRRGLLKNIKMSEPVEKIMNHKPISIHRSASREIIRSVLEENKLIQIPLLDDDGVVVGVETLEHISWPKRRDNIVFLMVGGYGTRLRPLTDNLPKPLLKVGQYPVLQNILENFIANGFYKFYLAVHYKSEMIEAHFGCGEKWGVEIQYIYEKEPLGTAGALGFLSDVKSPVIVMNGDLLTKVDFPSMLAFHFENESCATVAVRQYDFQLPYGLLKSEGAKVTGLVEKPVYHFFVNAGFYVLSPYAISQIKKNVRLDMTDLLKKLIQMKKNVTQFPVHEYWLDIGRFDDFEQAQKDIVKYF